MRAGVSCPETERMENLEEALEFIKEKTEASSTRYIVKPAVYDHAARTEVLFMPIADAEKQYE